MDDMFMKYGMVILGVMIIGIMIMFGFKATKDPLIPIEEHQKIEGDSYSVEMRINQLCAICLNEKSSDRDCFILDTDLTKGNLTQDRFPDKILLEKNLTVGRHIIKISSVGDKCGVRVFE